MGAQPPIIILMGALVLGTHVHGTYGATHPKLQTFIYQINELAQTVQ